MMTWKEQKGDPPSVFFFLLCAVLSGVTELLALPFQTNHLGGDCSEEVCGRWET